MIPHIDIRKFNYELPQERIAKYPLPQRDASKLLCCRGGKISEDIFRNIQKYLPEGALMVFNNTKVVPARLHFCKSTGAVIEIFCLEPDTPNEYNLNFAETSSCRWKCIVGNAKKWKSGSLVLYNCKCSPELMSIWLTASLISRDGGTSVVQFDWKTGIPFSKVLEMCGNIPIPPYLDRETEDIDLERYQTTYAHYRGSVAAPTAGLHFTDEVLDAIRNKGIDEETVCLHVGAGTFLPVKSDDVAQHRMHREPFTVTKSLIDKLLQGKKLIAVGTTSVRTLESLYYAGVGCIENGHPDDIDQWAPYGRDYKYSTEEALRALAGYMDARGADKISLGTSIIIVPGFKFRLVDILVTNFHQPQSTLLLLISAFLGGKWRPVYDYALEHDFRFLSYGDSSLLFRYI